MHSDEPVNQLSDDPTLSQGTQQLKAGHPETHVVITVFCDDALGMYVRVDAKIIFSETYEIRTPLGRAKRVPYSEVSSFQRIAVWDQTRCPYFTGCPHFTGLLFTCFTVVHDCL
jgi:hypothetical protein